MALAISSVAAANHPKAENYTGPAQSNPLETLKAKRFALLGFEPPEAEALRTAIDFASAHMHTITPNAANPVLISLTPFDLSVVNLSSGDAAGLLSTTRKPAIIIGDPEELLRRASSLVSPVREFIIRPWQREDFYLRAFLLLRETDGPAQVQPTRAAAVRTEPIIVVADDDRTTVMMVQSILHTWKVNCMVAQNGKDAIALTKKIKPSVLLLDVHMPDMDGFQVLTALRSDPSTRTIPIVMLTAAQSETEIVRGFELGADDYITKPFRAHEMLARLKRLVRVRDET